MLPTIRFMAFYCVLLLAASIDAALVEYAFEYTRGIMAPDTAVEKSVILVNGQFIGPPIEAEVGDTVRVTVKNSFMGMEDFNLHFHGNQFVHFNCVMITYHIVFNFP